MATKVVHGAHPRFGVPLGRGWYRITITGHYTRINGLTVAGVTRARWNSTRKSKQQNELLGLRTAFLHFYMREWMRTGGTWNAGIKEVTAYPWRRLRKQIQRKKRR